MIAEIPMINAESTQTNSSASHGVAKRYHISRENASELARLSHVRRKERAAMVELKPAIPAIAPELQPALNPLGAELMRVQNQLVKAMIGEKDAAEVSKLARALRDVRETYHLVTGQAKPGTQHPQKPGRSRQPAPQSLPEPDDAPQQVVSSPISAPDVNDTHV